MAEVHYNSTTKTFPLDKTAGDILNELVPLETLQYCDLFFHSRKIGREQVLETVKGVQKGKVLRILERKSETREQQRAPKDLREQAVGLDNILKRMTPHAERMIVDNAWKPEYIENLLQKFPVITEQPALINVLTDFSMVQAMFHEEHGFIQQHPIFIKIVLSLIEACETSLHSGGLQEAMRLSSRARERAARREQPGAQQPAALPRLNFTSNMLQEALAQSLVGNVGASVPGPSAPANNSILESMEVDAPAPPVRVDNNERFASENAQLHELGFGNDEENIAALIVCEGDVGNAIEFIITTRSQMDDLD